MDNMFFDNWHLRVNGVPTLRRGLLWEYDISSFDWDAMRGVIVERVIERGREEDFYAIFQLYEDVEGVRKIIKDDVPYLSNKDISFVCAIFNLKKEELKCYARKLSRRELLIY
jgi:hypothetical protein